MILTLWTCRLSSLCRYIQQQDTAFDVAIQYGIVLALLYACVQVLRTLEGVI